VSLEAYIWAANLPLSKCNGTPFRVLLQLADRADKLGYGAYPSVSTIADTLECSERTVQRALRDLSRLELIREGDQRYVEHMDPRYRPTVYDVLTTALRVTESRGDNHVTASQSRGDKSGRVGVTTAVAHRTVQEPTYQDSPRHLTLVTARESEEQ
jgi:DNA-binding transcriptional regulator YhcF (GntR family)